MYVKSSLIYGLEALVLEKSELEALELHHRKNLRYLQHLPESTAIPAIHLVSGVPPVEALLDTKILTLYRTIILAEANTPPALYIREIIIRQLTLSDIDSRSWISQVRRILVKYNHLTACQLLNNPPEKIAWYRTVRQAVTEEWSQRLQQEASEKTSLCFLNISLCEVDYLHPV